MPSIEVSLPDKLESEITRLVEQGEFINREQAVEDLLSTGISVYDDTEASSEETFGEEFSRQADDQVDPATRDDVGDDDYAF
ncbi:MAG: Arc/MetJ-type ribon-helix-helix transcriptional regulator [Haloarculaceae archaeon]|jgi:Arc/MetJ-type ribon-helix-helix transcriptional regulator